MQFKPTFLSLFAFAFTAVNGQAANLTSLLSSTPELSALAEMLMGKPALLEAIMKFPTNLTILAPSNDAFEELMKMNTTAQDSVPMTGNSVDTIEALLTYHALNGTFFSTAFVEGETAAAMSLLMNNSYANLANNMGQVVFGRNDGKSVSVYSGLGMASTVQKADIEFNKGVIHIIDR